VESERVKVRPGHIGNTTYRKHRLHFWTKRVIERLQGSFLQINVAKIVIHKADQPNTLFDFLERLELYGGVLYNLKAWQSKYRFQGLRAWGFMWDWPGRLKKIADDFKEKKRPNN
jgi:hypothetical protein